MIQATLQIPDYNNIIVNATSFDDLLFQLQNIKEKFAINSKAKQNAEFLSNWFTLSENISNSWDNVSVSDEIKYQREKI